MKARTAAHPVAASLLVVAATTVSACGSSPRADVPAPSTTAYPPAGFNADDLAFATNMEQSFQQTTDLVSMVRSRSPDSRLVDLATEIGASQNTAMMTLRALSVQWRENPSSTVGSDLRASSALQGVVAAKDISQIQRCVGGEFDARWLDAMTTHTNGAVAMARFEIAHGFNPDGILVAHNVLDAGQSQVQEMTKMHG